MNRIHFVDYAKALAIFCVVAVHVGFYQINLMLLFVMPMFFVATGYSFNPTKRSLKENILLRFKTIMIPFWIYMGIYTIVELIRAPIFGYGSWKVLFSSLANLVYGSGYIPGKVGFISLLKDIMSYKFQPITSVDIILPSNCHLWFLPAMFVGYVLFIVVEKFTREKNLLKIISIIILLLVASLEVEFASICQLPYGIGRGAIGACFMLVGFEIKKNGLLTKNSFLFHLITCIFAVAICAVSIYLGSDGSAMVRSYYGPYGALSVFITFVGGVAGTWITFELCQGIEKLPFTVVKKFLSFAGKNVITIYLLHMAVKFIFDFTYIFVFNKGNEIFLDEYKMGLLPENSFFYMMFEVILIIFVCLIFTKQKERLKRIGC